LLVVPTTSGVSPTVVSSPMRRRKPRESYAMPVWLDTNGSPTTLPLAQMTDSGAYYQFNNQTFYPLNNLGWIQSGRRYESGLV